jgi:hypothetical protein
VTDTAANNSSINVITQCRYANSTGYNFIYGDWGIVREIDQVSATNTLRDSVTKSGQSILLRKPLPERELSWWT